MGKFFGGTRGMSERELNEAKYRDARVNLLIGMIATVVNCVLAVVGADMYFLFSITFPYAMALDGAASCGLVYDLETYRKMMEDPIAEFLPMPYLYIMLAVAVIPLIVYLLCWIFSKKRVGWLIAATALFVIDSLFLILYFGVDVSMLLDYIFHAWMLFILIRGILAHFKLKALPNDPAQSPQPTFVPMPEMGEAQEGSGAESTEQAQQAKGEQATDPQPAGKPDTPVLHRADFSVKSRVLLQEQVQGYDICYRRVGKINELVVNSMVYDILDTGLVETAHELSCTLDGHEIAVGTDTASQMYIRVDGAIVKKKLRIF